MAAALALITASCGSQLSEEQVLERSGTRAPAARPPGATTEAGVAAPVDPTESTSNPTLGSVEPGSVPSGDASGPTPSDALSPGEADVSGCATSETGPIVIGNVGNYSGPGGAGQANMPRAVQIWATAINDEGGLCGRQVQVLVQDDGGDPARYAALVRNMVEDRHVVAFVGNGAALSGSGGVQYHNESGVPVLGPDCAHRQYFSSPVIAPACATQEDVMHGFVRTGLGLTGGTRYGYLYCTEAEACREIDGILQGGVVEQEGGELVYRQSISLAQIDFTAECQTARSRGVEVFSVFADPATLARAARSCSRQNYTPQYIQGGITVGPESVNEPGLERMALIQTAFPYAGGSGPAIDQYHQTVEAYAPGQPRDAALGLGWTAAKLFEVLATRAANSSNSITSQTLVEALHEVSNETLGGLAIPLTFRPDGAHPSRCYFVMQGDGEGGYATPLGSDALCL